MFFWILRCLLYDVRRRVIAVRREQDLTIVKRRNHLINIYINFQPGPEGPLSVLLSDLKQAIKQSDK